MNWGIRVAVVLCLLLTGSTVINSRRIRIGTLACCGLCLISVLYLLGSSVSKIEIKSAPFMIVKNFYIGNICISSKVISDYSWINQIMTPEEADVFRDGVLSTESHGFHFGLVRGSGGLPVRRTFDFLKSSELKRKDYSIEELRSFFSESAKGELKAQNADDAVSVNP